MFDPQIIGNLGIQGGILPEDVDRILADNKEIESVLIVSPTYDGIVSDVEEIARVVHRHGKPLIVDEAHGAHFPFCDQVSQISPGTGGGLWWCRACTRRCRALPRQRFSTLRGDRGEGGGD